MFYCVFHCVDVPLCPCSIVCMVHPSVTVLCAIISMLSCGNVQPYSCSAIPMCYHSYVLLCRRTSVSMFNHTRVLPYLCATIAMFYYVDVHLCLWSTMSRLPHRLVGLVVKASASRAEGSGFESRSRRDFFRGRVIPVTSKLALQWLPCQAPGVIGSALGLVGPVSVYCDRVR